jgi:TRAF3-interacting protein 1
MTHQLLGSVISKPKLTQKLLSKPPFRFLHDILTEVIKTTGFASGLYNDEEMDSSKVTEKQQKLDFLEKAVRVVGTQLNTIVEAKPQKIIAGLDPQATNHFLQLLAIAAKYNPNSENAVSLVLNGGNNASPVPIINVDNDNIGKSSARKEEKSMVNAKVSKHT